MRIEKPESIISVNAYRPLEEAVETATINLMDWLITEYDFTPEVFMSYGFILGSENCKGC